MNGGGDGGGVRGGEDGGGGIGGMMLVPLNLVMVVSVSSAGLVALLDVASFMPLKMQLSLKKMNMVLMKLHGNNDGDGECNGEFNSGDSGNGRGGDGSDGWGDDNFNDLDYVDGLDGMDGLGGADRLRFGGNIDVPNPTSLTAAISTTPPFPLSTWNFPFCSSVTRFHLLHA